MYKTSCYLYTGATTYFIDFLKLGEVVLYHYNIYAMSSLIVTNHSHNLKNTDNSHDLNYLSNNIDSSIMVEQYFNDVCMSFGTCIMKSRPSSLLQKHKTNNQL